MKNRLALALSATVCFTVSGLGINASYAAQAADVPMVKDGLSGVVTSAKGPEAGVWVVAETSDLPTRFIKIVVTDDQGRYVIPDMPNGKYKVWVRGYGLIDSKQVDAQPGAKLNLTAVVAPTAKDAAQYYPANYWYSMVRPPAADEFPGTGPKGNGIAPTIRTQQDWMVGMKERCVQCHQLGDQATREMPNSSVEAWLERVKQFRPSGDRSMGEHGHAFSAGMANNMTMYGRRGVEMFNDWTRRIAAGELPKETPPRPAGIERNVVLTEWDWGEGSYVHDVVASDRRNPNIAPRAKIYGALGNTGQISVLDPVTNKASILKLPGNKLDDTSVYPHTLAMDAKGRMWSTNLGKVYLDNMTIVSQRPSFCSDAKNPYGKYFPYPGPKKGEIIMFDPKTEKLDMIPSCFTSHHLGFTHDANDTLYFTGDGQVIGWVKAKVWDETRDAAKAVGWCPAVLDTNGDGKITPDRAQWNEPAKDPGWASAETVTTGQKEAAPIDKTKDTRVAGGTYGMDVNPKDNSVWFLHRSPINPSALLRFEPGANPPETCKSEYYQPPKLPDGSYAAYDGRGVAVDSNGIVYASFGSGQMGRFDRSKCKVMNGPTATGQQCPEGWTFYNSPGPNFEGVKNGSADFHYVAWVDRDNIIGLGKDVPIMPGTNSDSMQALINGKWLVMRVPYPMGFFARGVDGRIDDPSAGWKGRGLWSSFSDVPAWHQEGGNDGSGPNLVHFQLRPDPLAF